MKLHGLMFLSIFFVTTSIVAQTEFDHRQITLNLSNFELKGQNRNTKGRKVCIGNVHVIIEDGRTRTSTITTGMEMDDKDIRGHWGKYYFREISDNPDVFQPIFRPVFLGLLAKIGIEVVPEEKTPFVADLYFMISVDGQDRKLVSPAGIHSRDGNWLFSKASEVYFSSGVLLNIRPKNSPRPKALPIAYGTEITVNHPVNPSIGGGFFSVPKSIDGRELLKFPQFVKALNTCMESLAKDGAAKLAVKMDEETVSDMWRELSTKN